jgi:hypothetical protein
MKNNIGSLDRVARIVIGFAFIAYALPIGFPETGWNWVGWIGLVPLATVIFNFCPLYRLIGVSTVESQQPR